MNTAVATESPPHLSAHWRRSLVCPACRTPLSARFSCAKCGLATISLAGILNFGVKDVFYEEHGLTATGRSFSSGLIDRVGLFMARHHYLHEICRAIRPGGAVVEIGCGGGTRFLGSRYDMLGVDVSTQSIRQASTVYGSVVQARVEQLPLADASADGLISSFTLEHFDDKAVGPCLAEMARVVKPGGVMIHYFDLQCDSPFYQWAERQNWYQRIFIDQKGHLGIRRFETWIELFRKSGFRPRRARYMCKSWLQDASIWEALIDNEMNPWALRTARAITALNKRMPYVVDVMTTLFQDIVEPVFPHSRAAKVILVLKRDVA